MTGRSHHPGPLRWQELGYYRGEGGGAGRRGVDYSRRGMTPSCETVTNTINDSEMEIQTKLILTDYVSDYVWLHVLKN